MKTKLKTTNFRLVFFLFISTCFILSSNVIAQLSHQDIVDVLSKKLGSLQTQLNNIKNLPSNGNTNVENNSELIVGIQNSINSLEEKVEDIAISQPVYAGFEEKLLNHLSNIEVDINKLVQLKLEEQPVQEATEEIIQSSNDEEETSNPIGFNIGTDIVSRYVWRGTDFGESPSIQPYISVSYEGFEFGTWGSYPFSSVSSGSNEHDLYLSYSHDVGEGSLGILLTDYYFPNGRIKFSNWDSDGDGAHTLELAASYSGPLDLMVAYNVYNDPDNSLYAELGYSFTISEVPVNIFLAGAKGQSGWYGITTDKFEIINLGLSGSKEIAILDKFSLAVSASYIMNPYTGMTFLVFGISI